MIVREILGALQGELSLDKAAGWDPVGLQFGDSADEITSLGICHEVSETVVTEAIEADLDALVAYHPLLFKPTQRLIAGPSPAGRAYRLIRAGVTLFVVHTAFDAARGGTADALLAATGASHTGSFGPLWGAASAKIVTFVPAGSVDAVTTAMAAEGAGRIGKYTNCSYRSDGIGAFFPGPSATPSVGVAGVINSEPETRVEMLASSSNVDAVVAALVAVHPYEEPAYDIYESRSNAGFVGRFGNLDQRSTLGELGKAVGTALGTIPRIAGARDRSVNRVAVVPGSGGALIGEAAAADVLVTGDISHHRAVEAIDRGLSIIDAGHAPTERPGMRALVNLLESLIPIDIRDMTDISTDPWEG